MCLIPVSPIIMPPVFRYRALVPLVRAWHSSGPSELEPAQLPASVFAFPVVAHHRRHASARFRQTTRPRRAPRRRIGGHIEAVEVVHRHRHGRLHPLSHKRGDSLRLHKPVAIALDDVRTPYLKASRRLAPAIYHLQDNIMATTQRQRTLLHAGKGGHIKALEIIHRHRYAQVPSLDIRKHPAHHPLHTPPVLLLLRRRSRQISLYGPCGLHPQLTHS